MKMTDGKNTINIEMKVWEDTKYSPDFSNDFFDAGCLNRDENDFYIVKDIDYCIDQAKEWSNESENNYVFLNYI